MHYSFLLFLHADKYINSFGNSVNKSYIFITWMLTLEADLHSFTPTDKAQSLIVMQFHSFKTIK